MYKARGCLTRKTCEMMVHDFLTICLDYCNALLYGLNKKPIKKLHAVQSSAALLATDTRIILPQCLLKSTGFQWKNELWSNFYF